MKLFTRYSRINFLATVIIFGLTTLALIFLLRAVIVSQFDENLRIEKEVIENYVTKYHRLPEIIQARDQKISYNLADSFENMELRSFHGLDPIENEYSDFREILFSIKADGDHWYRINVAESIEGTENMIQLIVLITITTIILILAANFFINRIVLKRLWHPFYKALDTMSIFKIGTDTALNSANTDIEEFSKLNDGLSVALNRANNEFRILKEFTENASHEMQTPLAIIRSKLDLIIQEESALALDEENIEAIYKAIDRLSRLNKSLLLLAKIENNQFNTISSIGLVKRIDDKLWELHEMIQDNGIRIERSYAPLIVKMDADLLDIMLNNLLSNAVKYNEEGGLIRITIGEDRSLTVTNTAVEGPLDASRIFHRFYKNGAVKEQTGLGLSILKQISVSAEFDISYTYNDGFHSFRVQW